MARTDAIPSDEPNGDRSTRATPADASKAVIEAVAERLDCSPIDLDPLYGAVDPEALDALCVSCAAGESESGAAISFRYEGFTVAVTVTPDGELDVDLSGE